MSGALWAEEIIDLRKKVEELEAGLDLCAEVFNQWQHSHEWYEPREQQFVRPMKKALEHPALQAAEKRRKDQYWRHLEKAAKEVDSWPAWKRGEVVKRSSTR
jgi:hypothetical protein